MERDSRKIIARLLREGFELVSSRGSHKLLYGDPILAYAPEERPAGRNGAQHRPDGRLEGRDMKTFIAVVEKDRDSAYGVRFPDVPGCFSAADDFNDVLPNAVDALQLYFEDTPVPEPRDLDVVRAEVAEEIAAGAALIAVPLVVTTRKPARVNVSLDQGTLAAIDAAARSRGLTRSAFLAQAATNEIEGRH